VSAEMTIPDEVVEAAARAMAGHFGPEFDELHRGKAHWAATGGLFDDDYRDVNAPRQDDLLDAARAALTASPLMELVRAAQAVLAWRVGDLPSRGDLRDNARSRAAIAQLAQALSAFPPSMEKNDAE
jgi:hypothetical protein